jgi:hypothetical protein
MVAALKVVGVPEQFSNGSRVSGEGILRMSVLCHSIFCLHYLVVDYGAHHGVHCLHMAIYWFGGFVIADNGETLTSDAIHILGGVITKPISIFENRTFESASTRSSLEASHPPPRRPVPATTTKRVSSIADPWHTPHPPLWKLPTPSCPMGP